ncbi:hypothetical protein MHYP_G00119120 [Metynnis hypsauchen]
MKGRANFPRSFLVLELSKCCGRARKPTCARRGIGFHLCASQMFVSVPWGMGAAEGRKYDSSGGSVSRRRKDQSTRSPLIPLEQEEEDSTESPRKLCLRLSMDPLWCPHRMLVSSPCTRIRPTLPETEPCSWSRELKQST